MSNAGCRNSVMVACLITIVIVLAVDAEGADMQQTFHQDVAFLQQHVGTDVLRVGPNGPLGPAIAVVADYQGRVMTSTAGGEQQNSYGWINYAHIESGEVAPHINVYGGEERFWLGPEGGQYALFFPAGSEFTFDNWQTPPLIDTEPFEVVAREGRQIKFARKASLTNYSGTQFDMHIERTVRILDADEVQSSLGLDAPPEQVVGYRTVNRLTNTGEQTWTQETGLPSIWLLGMYKHGPQTTVVVPFRAGAESQLGPIVNDNYFGKIDASRLRVVGDAIYFLGDGTSRGKIGISPERSLGICGSYDAARGVLTIVKYAPPQPATNAYVNSQWALQDDPYSGDAINSYNDGSPAPGEKPLGPFYELETSSPALALAPKATGEHTQETYHFEGTPEQLDPIARAVLGVELKGITSALTGNSAQE